MFHNLNNHQPICVGLVLFLPRYSHKFELYDKQYLNVSLSTCLDNCMGIKTTTSRTTNWDNREVDVLKNVLKIAILFQSVLITIAQNVLIILKSFKTTVN